MTYVAVDPATLPKRQRRGRGFDDAAKETANALLAIVSSAPGQTATDSVEYAEIGKARTAASKARRLLLHVAPNADLVRTRVYGAGEKGDQAPFAWVIYLATEKPAKGKGDKSK